MDECIVGKQPIIEALRAGRVKEIFLREGIKKSSINELLDLSRKQGVSCKYINRSDFNCIVRRVANHQGVAARVNPFSYYNLDEIILWSYKKSTFPFLLILDHLQDPRNFGSLLRTAEATGVHGVIIPTRRSVKVNNTVAKTSSGAVEHIPIIQVANLDQSIKRLKKEGFWIIGLEQRGSISYFNANYNFPLALIIGSEGKGISRLIQERCDELIKIPMKGKVTSLNASVAGSLIMYETWRHREGW